MKRFGYSILILLASSAILSQITLFPSAVALSSTPVPPPVEWTKTYGGIGVQQATSVQQTSDGGYALFGTHGSNGLIVKIDSNGIEQWEKTVEIEGYELDIRDGQETSDGGFILIGGLPNVEWIDGSGFGDAFIIKTDELGNIQWYKIYGGSGHDYAFSGQQTSDGGYVLAGISNNDFYLVKTDSFGNLEWNKNYGDESVGEIVWSVIQTSDGGYILAGKQSNDAFVVRTDQNGNVLWKKTFGEPDNRIDWFNDVQQTSDGGYILTGCFNLDPERNFESGDFWLVKIDNSGNVQWSKYYGDSGFPRRHYSAKSVQQTTDNGFIVSGRLGTYDIWVLKTDSVGGMIWNKTFATFSPDESDIIQTTDKGYAVTGSSQGISQEYASDFLLIKIMRANPPVANFEHEPQNALVQQEIHFNASSSYDLDNDISYYKWDFKDGNITTTTSPIISHAYTTPGIYNVNLTVADTEELTNSYAKIIYTKINTSISISASSQTTYTNTPVTISGTLKDAYGIGIKNAKVNYYGTNSELLFTISTDDLGRYIITWNPSKVGSFTIKVEWEGNQTHYGTSNSTNIVVQNTPTNLSIHLSSSTSDVGLKVAISGSLTSNGVELPYLPVLLSYSVTDGKTWNEISLANTGSDGSYSVVWIPSATAEYIVKATWAGNSTIQGATAIVNLRVVSFNENSIFFVESNSTLSSLTFDSTNSVLSFSVSGSEETKGFTRLTIGKNLISNLNTVEVTINGIPIEYITSSFEDSWILYFTYSHSTHEVSVFLGKSSFLSLDNFTFNLLIGSIVIGLVVVLSILYLRGKRKK